MSDFIMFIIISIITFYLFIKNIRLANKNMELASMIPQLLIDNTVLKQRTVAEDYLEKDHLIKFLTDTREVAFSEIEGMQYNISNFVNEIEPYVFLYKDASVQLDQTQIDQLMEKVVFYYDKLKDFLPLEEEVEEQ